MSDESEPFKIGQWPSQREDYCTSQDIIVEKCSDGIVEMGRIIYNSEGFGRKTQIDDNLTEYGIIDTISWQIRQFISINGANVYLNPKPFLEQHGLTNIKNVQMILQDNG